MSFADQRYAPIHPHMTGSHSPAYRRPTRAAVFKNQSANCGSVGRIDILLERGRLLSRADWVAQAQSLAQAKLVEWQNGAAAIYGLGLKILQIMDPFLRISYIVSVS